MTTWQPRLARITTGEDITALHLGDARVDRYLAFVGARGRRNTWLATAFDLKVFFDVVAADPCAVTTAHVLDFIRQQRQPRHGDKVVRLEDGEAGLAIRTVKRRLASVSGLYAYLVACGEVAANPVPRGLATRTSARRDGTRGAPLLRTPRTLPRVLAPEEVNALLGALRTLRDRAMVEAMVLGGLRRGEVLALRLGDVRPGEHRLFVAEGKGGHQRIVPLAARFFATLARYLEEERPETDSDRVFVALTGKRRGRPLGASGLSEILEGARRRADLAHATCHELRHTCMTRLREAGMSLEAVQAQAGHRSIESTRVYLHLSSRWLAEEYERAIAAIEAQTVTAS